MAVLDYTTIILFTLIIMVVGLSFGKQGGDMKSFFAAGGAVPWGINGLSLFMSFFSAGTFVVWGSIAYEYGLVAITIQMAMCLSGFLIGYFIAPKWRATNALTVAEYLTKRFGEKVQKYYTYLFLFLSLGYTGSFLYPVAKIVNVSTGFDIYYSILLLGGIIMVYTAVGGLWAVVVTDVLQFVILTAAVLIVLPLSIDKVGGLANFADSAPETFFNAFNGEYSPLFIAAFCAYNLVFIGGNWAYVQRYTSTKSTKSASKVGYLFGALYLVSPIIWMLPPMIYKVINPTLNSMEAEGAYLMICKEVLPIGMLGLMIGGMIFATASSVNTSLNLAAAVLTNDVYKPLKPSATDQNLMVFARISTLVFGILTIGVAFLVPLAGGIVEVVLSIGAVTGGALYGPAIWSLFSSKQTGKSILGVTLISLTVNLFFKFLSPLLLGFSLDRSEEMILGVGLPFLLLLGYEFIGKESLNKTQSDSENEMPETSNASGEIQNIYGMKVLSIAMVTIGALFLVLTIWADQAAIYLLILGLVIMVFGGLLYRFTTQVFKLQKEN